MGLESIGAPTPADFSVAKHIKALKLRARATGEFTKNQLTNFSEATIQETHKNAVDTSKPESGNGSESPETGSSETGGGSTEQGGGTDNPSGGSGEQGGDSGIG